jgi:hypothetical protein
MSGQTPRTPEQRPIGVAPGTPPDQGIQEQQAPNAPARRRRQATGSRGFRRRLNLGGDEDEDEERRRERQQQFNRDMDDAGLKGQTGGDIVSRDPTVPPLMNVPELKL